MDSLGHFKNFNYNKSKQVKGNKWHINGEGDIREGKNGIEKKKVHYRKG